MDNNDNSVNSIPSAPPEPSAPSDPLQPDPSHYGSTHQTYAFNPELYGSNENEGQ